VLLVRGGFTVFSLGLNSLADELRNAGYRVDVASASLAPMTASGIADELSREQGMPLVIVGHSLGADLTPHLASYFEGRGIPVKLAVLLDSPFPASMPVNVRRCVNIYNSRAWSAPVLSGRATSGMSGRTEVFNVDLAQLAGRIPDGGINHFTIDASPWIHQVVIRAVRLSCEETAVSVAEAPPPPRQVSPSYGLASRAADTPRAAELDSPSAAELDSPSVAEPSAPSDADAGPRFRR
jgi:hypothetical protein